MTIHYDLTGQQFGRLTVLKLAPSHRRGYEKPKWICRCECGATARVLTTLLLRKLTISCGCYGRTHGHMTNRTHGLTDSPEFAVWHSMKTRCLNRRSSSWPRYGARGITICHEWADNFERFYRDMGPRPSPQHSIDRIDNDGHYDPGNCRWATMAQQQNNKSVNVRLTYNGETHSVREWSRLTQIGAATLYNRIRRGWTHDQALGTKPGPYYRKK